MLHFSSSMINIFINISWNYSYDFKPEAKEKKGIFQAFNNKSFIWGKEGWTKKIKIYKEWKVISLKCDVRQKLFKNYFFDFKA